MQHKVSAEIVDKTCQASARHTFFLVVAATLIAMPSMAVATSPIAATVESKSPSERPPVSTVGALSPATGSNAAAATPQAIVDKARWEARSLERARARWKLIIEKRYDDAYSFLTETGKALLSKEQHAGQLERFDYLDGVVDKAECTATVCTVKARGTITIKIPRIGSRPQQLFLDESWVLIGDEMWLLQK